MSQILLTILGFILLLLLTLPIAFIICAFIGAAVTQIIQKIRSRKNSSKDIAPINNTEQPPAEQPVSTNTTDIAANDTEVSPGPECSPSYFTTTEFEGTHYMYASVRKANTDTPYRLQVEITAHTVSTEKYTPPENFELINTRTVYELEHIYWGNGGYASFACEISPGTYASPRLTLDTETTVTDNKGNTYHITLTDETVEISQSELYKLNKERRKFKKFKDSVFKDINKLLDDAVCQCDFFASIIADYRKHLNLRVSEELRDKKRPALKAAGEVKRISKELHQSEKELRILKYQTEIYENLFPWLTEYKQISLGDIKDIQAYSENTTSEKEYFGTYLSPKEYETLTYTQKCQLKLDRYRKRKKIKLANRHRV